MGESGDAFEDLNICTLRKWALHDLAVSSDPSHVRSAEVDVARLGVETQFLRKCCLSSVAANCVLHALGFASGP